MRLLRIGGCALMRDRLLWVLIALVLAAMAVSLWDGSKVAGAGAGIAALYAVVAAIRGRCFGSVCALPVQSKEPAEDISKG